MDELTDKRVVILGLARQGTALARFAAGAGAEVIVSDLRPAESLQDNLDQLSDLDVEFLLGEHPMSLLEGTDVLAVSGGVPSNAPIVAAARRRGIRVTNDSLEFARRCPAPIVGITGSAGKTTTTALTGAMGRESGRQTWIGGNIGRPLIGELGQIAAEDLVVQELSSFQLEIWSSTWGNHRIRAPQVAAILNVTPNHLNRHETMAAYAAAKGNILRYQSPDDVAVLCADDSGALELQSLASGRLRTFSMRREVSDGAFVRQERIWLKGDGKESDVCHVGEVRLLGEHNMLNVLAAVTLADSATIAVEAMRRAIRSFTGVAHRLETVALVNGVRYVNDSIATAPERALAAIAVFDEPLILLAGGQDKEMRWESWARRVARRARHVVLFGELGPALAARLRDQEDRRTGLTCVSTLEEAVETAGGLAREGDVVLLAPGGTSFDAFRDFEERGERFRELVGAL